MRSLCSLFGNVPFWCVISPKPLINICPLYLHLIFHASLIMRVGASSTFGGGGGGVNDVLVRDVHRLRNLYIMHFVYIMRTNAPSSWVIQVILDYVPFLSFREKLRWFAPVDGSRFCLLNTGSMDGFWARAKMAIPTSMHTLTSSEVNPQIFKCLQRYCWRWENTTKYWMLCAGNAVSNILRR